MSDTTGCYYDAAGCLVCPEQSAQAYVPARIEHQPVLGWNAGANSVDVHDGDLHVVFDQPLDVVGVVIGLKTSRARVTVPSLIEHGWYFQKSAGVNLCQPIEQGKVLGGPITGRLANDTFEIRRVNGQVTYLRNGAFVALSPTRSSGPKLVNACLYASGDMAPSGGGTDTGGGHDPGSDVGTYPGQMSSGVGYTVAGLFDGVYSGDDAFRADAYWYIDVPDGASNLAVVLSGSAEDLATADGIDPYIYAVTAPSAVPPVTSDYNTTANDHYLSGPSDPPPGGTPWRLDIAAPTAGRWYFASDSTVAGTFTLTATVT